MCWFNSHCLWRFSVTARANAFLQPMECCSFAHASNKFKWQKLQRLVIKTPLWWLSNFCILAPRKRISGCPRPVSWLTRDWPSEQIFNTHPDSLSQDMQSYQRDGPALFEPCFSYLFFGSFSPEFFWGFCCFLPISQWNTFPLLNRIKHALQMLLSQAHFYS